MSVHPTPRHILETLLPHLQVAAAYAQQIQSRIVSLPDKAQSTTMFAAALSDADLSIQTMLEVVLLGQFPNVRFFGEEHATSYNTKYFRARDLGPPDDYLVTLDPIDGTRFYLDGHRNYQIILSVLNHEDFEAVLALSPAHDRFYYGLKDQGTFWGTLSDTLDTCQPLHLASPHTAIYLGSQMESLGPYLQANYDVITLRTNYSSTQQIANLNGILSGEIAGAAIAKGKFIDGAALAFLAQEMGYIVTTISGKTLPPLHTCQNYARPALLIAASPLVHRDLLKACYSHFGNSKLT